MASTFNIGVYTYGKTSTNIGDFVQSIASANIWAKILRGCSIEYETPRLRRLFMRCNSALKKSSGKTKVKVWELERDHQSEITKKIGPNAKIHVVANGWYHHRRKTDGKFDWPPPPNVCPIFVSFHVTKDNGILTREGIAYLKKHEPIGCRDYKTLEMLQKKKIKAWFSGCLTLTLDSVFPYAPSRHGTYVVDTKFHVRNASSQHSTPAPSRYDPTRRNPAARKASAAVDVTHVMDLGAMVDPFDKAYSMLRMYSRAERVITSRIHCMLPCLAFETPVLFVDKEGRAHNPDWEKGARFGGIIELARRSNTYRRLAIRENLYVLALGRAKHRLISHRKRAKPQKPVAPATAQQTREAAAPQKSRPAACTAKVTQDSKVQDSKVVVRHSDGRTMTLQGACSPATLRKVRNFVYPTRIEEVELHAQDGGEDESPAARSILCTLDPLHVRYVRADGTSRREQWTKPADYSAPADQKVHALAFTSDINYLRHLPTVLHSIEKHNGAHRGKVLFRTYVILRGVSASSTHVREVQRQVFSRLEMFQLVFVENKRTINYRNNLKHVTMSCIDRLWIPELVKEKLVLYLDLDILCTGDITGAFKADTGPKGIAAKNSVEPNVVRGWLEKVGGAAAKHLKYIHPTSVNAGVMLMDTQKLKHNKFSQKTIHMCHEFGVNDQIAVNFYLDGQKASLPGFYNVYFGQDDEAYPDKRIVHFAGSSKPWHKDFRSEHYSRVWANTMLS